MKKIILTSGLFLLVLSCIFAQQERQYTQFMYNKLTFNPGYAGSYSSPVVSGIYRQQWIGLEGAPQSQLLSFHKNMLNDRIGFGLSLSRTAIGINTNISGDLAYAYRFKLKTGMLGVGLQASIRYLNQNWTDPRLNAAQPLSTDDAIPMQPRSKMVPNFGVGVFYNTEKYYVGIGLPRIVSNNIDFAELGGVISREVRHYFFMGGYSFDVAEGFELTPQFLVKYVPNTPFDADINVTGKWNNRVSGGLTYRLGSGTSAVTGESVDVLAGFQVNPKLFFALSYDISLTKLRKYSNGSIEALVRYYIKAEEEITEDKNPRYF